LVAGSVELAIVNQELGLTLPTHAAYQTIAGFMIHQLGRLPAQGERLVWGELELEAVNVLADRLDTILLRQVTRPLAERVAEPVLLGK
jgi:CBS domain containing-hemolysin-like protein